METQSLQAKYFFNKDSRSWSKKSKFSKKKLQNIVQQRNNYVFERVKKIKPKIFLDVGCGSGDLVNETVNFTKKSVGIDYADKMISIAKKKFNKRKSDKIEFHSKSIFEYKTKKKFNLISANGFIEYLSVKEFKKFIKISKKLLSKNGYIILSSRNRLFNAISMNDYTLKEIKTKMIKDLVEEIINLKKLNLKNLIKTKKKKIFGVDFKQPKTGIDVNKRHQYTPNQLVNFLIDNNFNIVEIFPINLHIFNVSILKENNEFRFEIKKNTKNKNNLLKFIPYASTFMLMARKK